MSQQHNTAQSGGVVYAVQNGDQYVYLYHNEPPYRVEPFPTKQSDKPEPLVRQPPSQLLSARHQVVPFYGRDDELARLRNWRKPKTLGVSVRLMYAPGGQGKTRMAAQFAEASTLEGWTVAVVRHRSETAAAGGGDQQLAVYKRGLVLIVDYAERWPLQDMVTLLRQHQAASSAPLRVLLLARPAGGWWQSLAYQLGQANINDIGQWELAPLAKHPPDRKAIYAAARDRFANVLGLSAPTATAGPDLGGSQFELVLAVHMKALVDVDAAARGIRPPSGRDQAGLSSYLLDREHDYWQAAYHNGTGPVRTSELGMSRTVYTATLTRALSHRDGVTALTRAKIGEATTQPVGQVLADHAVLYPPTDPDTILEPLYPDRLGEDFLALTTPGHTDTGHTRVEPWAATLPAQLLTTDDGDAPPYARASITMLIEAAHRWPHLAQGQLYPIIRQRPRLAFTAGGAALTRLADLQHSGILDVLHVIEPHLPEGRHVDLDSGIAALTTRLTTHRLATTTDPAARARLYANLGYRLALAGQREEALAATTEAVDMYRRLVGVNSAAFEPEFASALNNLGDRLSGLGRREEALAAAAEAVEIRRRLVRVNSAAFEPDLASALNNLGMMLWDLGRREEALAATTDAVDVYRRLVGVNSAVFEPELARALNNELARALNNLSVDLSGLGRREEALAATTEAVEVYRRLVGVNPAVFEPDLARALSDLGVRLSGLGRREEALAATTEAVEVYRRLVGVNPAVFEPDLARVLNNLSVGLSGLGRREEALAATTEAVDVYRRLVEVNPAAFEPEFALALSNLGNRLSGLEALAATTEAVDVYRRLVGVNPAAFEPDFARVLHNLSVGLSGLGRREEALAAATEAVEICRRLVEVNPAAFAPDLARMLNNLGNATEDRQMSSSRTPRVSWFRRWRRRA